MRRPRRRVQISLGKLVQGLFIEGGLRVWNLLKLNCTLLEKWLWLYVHERETWWRVAMDSKSDSSCGGWYSRFEEGDGAKVRSRHYLCCGGNALKEPFSDLYSIPCAKDASMAAHLECFVALINGT
jgi:hypothetical protein